MATLRSEKALAIVDLVGKHGPRRARSADAASGLRGGRFYSRRACLSKITPYDLRRTLAKLAHQGRTPFEQIQISLGHASIQTTEMYFGLWQNLHDAPCDQLGLVEWEG